MAAALQAGNIGSMGNTESAEAAGNAGDMEDDGTSGYIGDGDGLPGMADDGADNRDETGRAKMDFGQLQTQNPDIYAWITVPGTGIDYPVLQKSDANDLYDDYYLDHQADLSEGFPGAVYSQPVNQRDFMDSVTVLYGHNLKNGGMFSELHEFEDEDFLYKMKK